MFTIKYLKDHYLSKFPPCAIQHIRNFMHNAFTQHVLLGKYLAIVLAIVITKVLLLHVNILDNVLHIELHCKRF